MEHAEKLLLPAPPRLPLYSPDATARFLPHHDRRALHAGVLPAADHQWPELPYLVSRRQADRLRHEGLDLAHESRREHGVRADRGLELRLDARPGRRTGTGSLTR